VETRPVLLQHWAEFLHEFASVGDRQQVPWDRNTFWALLSLVGIWGALFALTWAHWGDLTVDSGREMYVAAELAQGKTLYSDIWYPYTPASPYVNSVLFRILGFNLGVLYWAGAAAALASAVLLFLTGLQLVPRVAAWTTGMVLILQSFVPSSFSFPLPYSFAAVYGCLSSCLCLWLIIKASSSPRVGWMVGAGVAASVALVMKQEFGAGCFVGLALLVILRRIKTGSSRRVAADVAALLPGCLLSASVIYWMISLRGAEFLVQQNLMSWPTSYFMKTYGRFWLANTGLIISKTVVLKGFASILLLMLFWLGFRWMVVRSGHRPWWSWACVAALAVVAIVSLQSDYLARRVRLFVFPSAVLFLVAVMMPVTAWLCWRTRWSTAFVQALLLFAITCGISMRILFWMEPRGYAIYYNGPIVLSYFLILSWLLGRKALQGNRSVALFPCSAALLAVSLVVLPLYKTNAGSAPLVTGRGVIYTSPQKSSAYNSVLDFIRRKQPDASFLSVPEDVSLYFLSGTDCPTRVYAFTPGLLAPGRITEEVIQEIEQKQVRYLIWSNRTFEEYGTPNFGVDFDRALGQYFMRAYRPIHTIGGESSRGWKAVIWERTSDIQSRGR
jgi:hypothetical protein